MLTFICLPTNAGENLKLKEVCESESMGITFEFTARNTPQQNGKVERMFATLWGRVRAMNRRAGFGKKIRRKLWAEAAQLATDLHSVLVAKEGNQCPYQKFFGKCHIGLATCTHMVK